MSQDCKQWHDCGQGARPKQIQGLLDSGYLMPSIDACDSATLDEAFLCTAARQSAGAPGTAANAHLQEKANASAGG